MVQSVELSIGAQANLQTELEAVPFSTRRLVNQVYALNRGLVFGFRVWAKPRCPLPLSPEPSEPVFWESLWKTIPAQHAFSLTGMSQGLGVKGSKKHPYSWNVIILVPVRQNIGHPSTQ